MMPARHSPAVSALPAATSPATLQRRGDLLQQLLAVERLGEEAEHAALRRATASGIVPCAVRMITGSAGCCAVDRLEQLHAVDAGHPQVGDHDAGPRDRERRQRRLAAVGGAHAIAGRRQPQADQLQQIGVVVDQQDVAGVSSLSLLRR